MNTEKVVNITGKVIIVIIVLALAGNSAFIAGYLAGQEKGRQEVMQALPLTPAGELRIRERIEAIEAPLQSFNGPRRQEELYD